MHSFITLLALAAAATAKTVVINVGQSGLSFSPDSSTASVGDTLEFHFFGSIHSAVQGDFSTPCQMSSSGFDSGTINNKADGSGSVFQVMVTDTNPIWFFCGTPGHCQTGMAGVINPPSSGDSLAGYKSSAAGTSSTSSGTVQGGVVVPAGGSSSSSSAPQSSSSASVSPTTSTAVLTSTPSSIVSTSSSVASSVLTASSSTSSSVQLSSSVLTNGTTSATSATSKAVTVASSTAASSSSLASPTSVATSGGTSTVGECGLLGLLAAGFGLLVGLM